MAKGGVRSGAGRRAKEPAAKQRNRLMVSLTDSEWEALVEAAGREALGSFIRGVLLRYLRRAKGRRA
jgi:hypothetical protein